MLLIKTKSRGLLNRLFSCVALLLFGLSWLFFDMFLFGLVRFELLPSLLCPAKKGKAYTISFAAVLFAGLLRPVGFGLFGKLEMGF